MKHSAMNKRGKAPRWNYLDIEFNTITVPKSSRRQLVYAKSKNYTAFYRSPQANDPACPTLKIMTELENLDTLPTKSEPHSVKSQAAQYINKIDNYINQKQSKKQDDNTQQVQTVADNMNMVKAVA